MSKVDASPDDFSEASWTTVTWCPLLSNRAATFLSSKNTSWFDGVKITILAACSTFTTGMFRPNPALNRLSPQAEACTATNTVTMQAAPTALFVLVM